MKEIYVWIGIVDIVCVDFLGVLDWVLISFFGIKIDVVKCVFGFYKNIFFLWLKNF